METERAYIYGKEIVQWYQRDYDGMLPWKATNDPYKIWISEIMSQQTRIEHVIKYYEKFVEAFPTVQDMAASDEDTILSMWSGLGYYSRARNLYKTACIVSEKYEGDFPQTYEDIRALPGIGEYTAAAIMSFAHGESYPVIDANVERIYARYNALAGNFKRKGKRSALMAFLQEAMKGHAPGDFNQAMMSFGAHICTPRKAQCEICPLNKWCRAYESGTVHLFPSKKKKKQRKRRYFHYLVLRYEQGIYLRKRIHQDIWQNMWEFPQLEGLHRENLKAGLIEEYAASADVELLQEPTAEYAQTLSHQHIEGQFYVLDLGEEIQGDDLELVAIKDLKEKAFPGIIRDYLKKEYNIFT